jgi:hypothetical protein
MKDLRKKVQGTTQNRVLRWTDIWHALYMCGLVNEDNSEVGENHRIHQMLLQSGKCKQIARGRYQRV